MVLHTPHVLSTSMIVLGEQLVRRVAVSSKDEYGGNMSGFGFSEMADEFIWRDDFISTR